MILMHVVAIVVGPLALPFLSFLCFDGSTLVLASNLLRMYFPCPPPLSGTRPPHTQEHFRSASLSTRMSLLQYNVITSFRASRGYLLTPVTHVYSGHTIDLVCFASMFLGSGVVI
jgi:hypothetical protein